MVDAPLTFVIDTSSIDLATQKLGSMLQATLNAETAAERAMNTVKRAFQGAANDVEPLVNQINRQFGLYQQNVNRFSTFSIGTPPRGPGSSFVPSAPPGGGGPPPRGPDFNDAAESGAAMIRELDRMRARFDPLFRITQQYRDELAAINRAHAVGALTTEQATVAADRLKVSTDALVASMRRRGEIPELMSRGIEQRMNIQHPGAFIGDAEASADAFTASLNETRAALVPIVRIMQEYEAGLERISKAYRYEEITADEATAAVKRHVEATNEAIAAGQRAGNIAPGRESFVGRAVDKDVAQQGEIDRARSQYDQLFRATQQYEVQIEKINQAHREEKISLDLATASITRKTAETNKLVASMQESGTIPRGREGFVGTDKERDEALRASLNRTRAEFDPLFAIGQRYKQFITEIKQANADGAISFDNMTAAIERERLRTGQLVEEERGRQDRAQRGNRNTQDLDRQRWMGQNLMFQLQDIAVTSQMGMDPAAIALQQGSQMGANFMLMKDTLGGTAGMAKSIGSAFAMLIDPLMLIPIAATFAGAALFQFFTGAEKDAKDLNQVLSEQKKIIESLGPAYSQLDSLRKTQQPGYRNQFQTPQVGRAVLGINLEDARKVLATEFDKTVDEIGKGDSVVLSLLQSLPESWQSAMGQSSAQLEFPRLRAAFESGEISVNEFRDALVDFGRRNPGQHFEPVIARFLRISEEAAEAEREVGGLVGMLDRMAEIRLPEARTYARNAAEEQSRSDALRAPDIAAAYRQQQQFQAEVQAMNARTMAERVAAARRTAEAQRDDTEGLQTRKERILQAEQREQEQILVELKNAELDRVEARKQAIATAELELHSIGRSREEQIRLQEVQQGMAPLLQKAHELGIKVNEDQARAVREHAAEYAKLKVEIEETNALRQREYSRKTLIEDTKLELDLIGQTATATAAYRKEYELLAELKRRAALEGREITQKELDDIHAVSEAYARLREDIARKNLANDLAFKARSAGLRDEEASVLNELRSRGLPEDLGGADAAMIRQMQQIDRLKDTWQELFDTVNDGMDGVVDALFEGTDPMEALKKSARDLARQFFDLAVTNPLKNFLTGANENTIADMGIFGSGAVSGRTGGFGGLLGNLFGAQGALKNIATSTMSVQAGVVNVTGSLTGTLGATGGAGGIGDITKIIGKDDKLLNSGINPANAAALGLNPANYAPGGMFGPIGGGAASAVAGTDTQSQIWNYFAGKGLQSHQIAGLMGNISAESGFNPNAVNPTSGAYGIAQWLDRKGDLFKFAGTQTPDLQKQLDFFWKELKTTESRTLKNLMASTNVEEATKAGAGFERAEGFTWERPEGIALFDKRLKDANASLDTFSEKAIAGAEGAAKLGGEAGKDILKGETGKDLISGETGKDILESSTGKDTFGGVKESADDVTESFDGVSEGSKKLTSSLSEGAEGISKVVSSLADGVGSMLSKLITQGGGLIPKMFGGGMFSGLSDAFGGTLPLAGPADSVGGSLFSGMWHVMHTGGVAGESGGEKRPFTADVAKLPRLHTGGLAGDEVPAILRKGEPVLPSVAALRGVTSGNDNSAVLGQILQAIQAQKLSAKFVNISDKREMLNEIGSDYGEQVFANTQRRSGTGRRL